MQRKVENIIKEVAEKHGIPARMAKKIFQMPYLFIKGELPKLKGKPHTEYPEIYIPSIGKMYTTESRVNGLLNSKDNKQSNGEETAKRSGNATDSPEKT